MKQLCMAAALALAVGCVTIPLNDEDVGESASEIDIRGYLDSGNDEVCVYVSSNGTSGWSLLSDDTTASTKTGTYYNTDLFTWAADATIAQDDWGCIGTSGDAETFLKVQERASGSCASTPSGSQSDLDYTWDDGTNISSCYINNQDPGDGWQEFLSDCPLSDDAPVIRIEAEATHVYGHCHGDCSASVPSSTCDDNYFLQTHPDLDEGGICQSTPIADAAHRYTCFKDCETNLAHSLTGDPPYTCASGYQVVGQNPGDLCDGSTELVCEVVNFDREL